MPANLKRGIRAIQEGTGCAYMTAQRWLRECAGNGKPLDENVADIIDRYSKTSEPGTGKPR